MSEKISVFGSSGFIGSKFCELYNNDAYQESRENNNPKYKNILYLISTVHNYNIFSDLNIDIDTNLKKLVAVLENCKRENLIFTYISTWFVIGDCKLPASEIDVPNPMGFYSITKLTSERLIQSFCHTFGIKYRIIRLSNIYGPNDKGVSKQKNALTYLFKELKNNNDINLYHDGQFLRDYLFLDDCVSAIKFLMDRDDTLNQIFHVGSGRPQVFRSLIDFGYKELNSTSKISSIEPPEFHKYTQIRDFWFDTSKINNLGWKPQYSIWDGLRKTIASL